jgi:hypothetical protein
LRCRREIGAPPHQGANRARARRREGKGREVWSPAETDVAPEARGDQAAGRRTRGAAVDRSQLQRQRRDDFKARALTQIFGFSGFDGGKGESGGKLSGWRGDSEIVILEWFAPIAAIPMGGGTRYYRHRSGAGAPSTWDILAAMLSIGL